MELNNIKENNTCEMLIDPEEERLNFIFTEKTVEILKELNLNTETLDYPNFSVVDYINEMFPNEQSLANIDDIMMGIDIRIKELDEENRQVLRGQWKTELEGQKSVQEATAMIQDLFSKIRDVQDRATHSENMVKEITRDIQQLDLAKKNLTISITTLNNLTLLMSSIDHLKVILKLNVSEKSSNPFDEIRDENGISIRYDEVDEHLLHSTKILKQLLSQYSEIPVIKDLNQDMQQIINELNHGKLQSDIRQVLMGGKVNANNHGLVDQLHAMCRVIDQLDPSIRTNLIKWFIDQQLSEYRVLFDETQTTAWLDKIDHRYSWLRSNLLNFDKRFSLFFPKSWMMTERLIFEFCEYTKQALSSLMRQRISELTDNLIIFAIKRTHTFEETLSKSFCSDTLSQLIVSKRKGNSDENEPKDSIEDTNSKANTSEIASSIQIVETEEESPLSGLISSCFEPHLHLYIEDVNKVLQDQLTNHLIGDTTINESSIRDKEFEEVLGESVRNEYSHDSNSDDSAENSLNSATNLFLFYRKLLNQAPQLSRGQTLVDLSKVLGKYLREYNNKVLLAQLPLKKTGVMSVANSLTGSGGPVLTANQIIQSLLKDVQMFRLSKEDIKKVSVILVTSCYCLKTVEELEKRLKSKVRPSYLSREIDFSGEIELFNQCRTSCVQLMASDLEGACEPAFSAMCKMNWTAVEAVGDQSNYVTAIVSHLRENVPLIRQYLHNVRAFFTQFCIQFVNGFISKFIATLFKCRVTTTVGAEQLLLDTHSLKTVLVKLPVIGSKIYPDPPRSFTAVVLQGMGHAEKIIKVVMTPCVRAADFVDGALHLLPDCDSVELQKILDMKGMKRPEQVSIIDLFKKKQRVDTQNPKPDNSANPSLNQEAGRMTQLEKLIKIIK